MCDKIIKIFLLCLHRYYVTCIKSVPTAWLHVWLIITYVYVTFGLMKVKVTDLYQGQCVFTLLMDCAGAKMILLDHVPNFEALHL